MTTEIRTYNDLLAEKKRVRAKLDLQKQEVIESWNGVKEELEPVQRVLGIVGKMVRGDKSAPLLNLGLKLASDALLKNLLLSRAGWLTKLAVPFVVKNYSSHLLSERGGVFLRRLGRLFRKSKT